MPETTEKDRAHELIDRLPPSEVPTAVRFLEFMLLDPVARSVATAPPGDEPVIEEDRRCIAEGEASLAQGRKGTPMEEVLAEFGLTMDDFPPTEKDTQ